MHDSQRRETVKYGHENRETRNQEWLCWRGPAAIDQTEFFSQLRGAVVRSEKLVAETGDSSGTQRKGDVRRWKPLPGNG
jgi:hypothetical protein